MPEVSKSSIPVIVEPDASDAFCTGLYDLRGPQVEPEASYWLECDVVENCPVPRPIKVSELAAKFPAGYPPYPTNPVTLRLEIEELIMLGRLRDEPSYRLFTAADEERLHASFVEYERARFWDL